uniref:Uncharacterized protein n=1 Tax=viral metagenome TaxID=1070528 RepID=A0A6M3LKY6_9ZZZZ
MLLNRALFCEVCGEQLRINSVFVYCVNEECSMYEKKGKLPDGILDGGYQKDRSPNSNEGGR